MSAAEEIDNEIDVAEVEDKEVATEAHDDDAHEPGFITKSDWVAAGRDPKEWRSPLEYRLRGEMIKRENKIRNEHAEEIKNLNLLHEVRLQNEREELLRLRDDAIDIADKAEVKRLDAKIANNEKQAQLIQNQNIPPKPREVLEWEEENPWSQNPNDPRLILANKICSEQLEAGKSLASALRAVDKEIAAKFTPDKKTPSQIVESSRTATGKKESASLTWGDLTPAEEKCYIPSMWKDKASFLKAVINDRKGK